MVVLLLLLLDSRMAIVIFSALPHYPHRPRHPHHIQLLHILSQGHILDRQLDLHRQPLNDVTRTRQHQHIRHIVTTPHRRIGPSRHHRSIQRGQFGWLDTVIVTIVVVMIVRGVWSQ